MSEKVNVTSAKVKNEAPKLQEAQDLLKLQDQKGVGRHGGVVAKWRNHGGVVAKW